MKKMFFWILFLNLIFISNQKVFAKEFDASFFGCNAIDCANSGYYINGKWENVNTNGVVSIHFGSDNNNYYLYSLPKCYNDGFLGWKAYVGNDDDNEDYVFCEDSGSCSDTDIFDKTPVLVNNCKKTHLFKNKFFINSDKYFYVQFEAVYKNNVYPEGVSNVSSGCYGTEISNKNNSNSSKQKISKNNVSCGNIGSINKKIPELTSWIITIAQIVVPVILVIFGVIDFVKAIVSQKEDEIKKGQQIFIKRLITGILIFFVVVIVKFVVSLLAGENESGNIINCIDCFISNKCN